jgi:diacylglycerol kinase family enzyme
VAVILNRNARRVTDQTVRSLGRLVPRDDLFVSNDLGHARRIAEEVANSGYDWVVAGGGDGTFVSCISAMQQSVGDRRDLPGFAVLRLGTGNATADAIGASDPTLAGFATDIQRARQNDDEKHLRLIEVEGQLTPFAGVGLDALILDDHEIFDRRIRGLGVGTLRNSNLSYLLSVSLRSIPRFLRARLPEVVAVNTGSPAIRVDLDGTPIGAPIPPGQVLFRGRCSLASASTIPYFGLGMRMFPQVERARDCFQLRCTDVGTYEILANLPEIWNGTYRSPRIHDFLCDGVILHLEPTGPLQVGGDLVGSRSQISLSLARQTVRVLA